MAACAESKPGIERDVDCGWIGRCVPSWHDPQACRYPNWIELRLSQPYPVTLFKVFDCVSGYRRYAQFDTNSLQNLRNRRIFFKKRVHKIVLPTSGSRLAGLAKNRLFV